jgi:hypothetical protein
LIGCCFAIALVASALTMPTVASAAKKSEPLVNEQYLALGNSLAFGYSEQLYHEGEAAGYEDPERFEDGYPNQLLKLIKGKAVKQGNNIKLVNDGCPGETSSSLIGNNSNLIATLNAALKQSQEEKGLPPVSGESPCAYQAAWNAYHKVGLGGPLHHPYSGSQLEDAINVIANGQKEGKPVTLVTLDIGANDELHLVAKIEKEAREWVEAKVAKVGAEYVEAKLAQVGQEAVERKVDEHVYIECSEKAYEETGGEEPGYVEHRENCLATEGQKLGGEYYAAHEAELQKEGKEAAEKYYGEHKAELEKEGREHAEQYAAEHAFELNQAGEIYGAELVGKDAPALFKQILSNISGIMVALRDGASLGLDNGKAVNYTGRIIFQGGYNPYGKLFHYAYEGVQFVEEHGGMTGPYKVIVGRCTVRGTSQAEEEQRIENGCTASEVQPGFTSLVKTLNGYEYETVHGGFGACMSFPANKFNPGTQVGEPERLKEWTNMTNGTQTKVGSELKWNGPDIHPTPAGYLELAKEMQKEASSKCHKEGLPGF